MRQMWLIFVLFFVSGRGEAQNPLRWKWEKDKPIHVRTESAFDQRVTLLPPPKGQPARRIDAAFTQVNICKYELVEEKDGSTVIEQELLRSEVRSPKSTVSRLEDLEGLKLKLTLSPEGKLTQLEGHDALMSRLLGDDWKTSARSRDKIIKSILSEEALRKSVEELTGFLPTDKERQAKKWERKSERDLGPLGKFAVTTSYTLDKEEKGSALIRSKTTFQHTLAKGSESIFAIVEGPDGEKSGFDQSEGTGTFTFDPENGRLVKSEQTLKLKGTLYLRTGSLRTRKTGVDHTLKTTITVTEKNPLEKPAEKE